MKPKLSGAVEAMTGAGRLPEETCWCCRAGLRRLFSMALESRRKAAGEAGDGLQEIPTGPSPPKQVQVSKHAV